MNPITGLLEVITSKQETNSPDVDYEVFVNPVTGHLETITLTLYQEFDDPEVEYEVLVNPVSGHLEKVQTPKKKKESGKVRIVAHFDPKATDATSKSDE